MGCDLKLKVGVAMVTDDTSKMLEPMVHAKRHKGDKLNSIEVCAC